MADAVLWAPLGRFPTAGRALPSIVRPPSPGPWTVPSPTQARIAGLRGAGRPLSPSDREHFETRFGRDLRGVRLHDGPQAAAAAAELQARAFTVGNDIAFGRGELRTGSTEGRRLLAHELTHVVQQSAATSLRVQREITEGSIRNGDFFSTNCGWVDAGHSNPGGPRTLIAQVREASQRIRRREEGLARTLAAEPPPSVRESACTARYEAGEAVASEADAPVLESTQHPSGAVDLVLGGFGVDSSAAGKFASLVRTVVASHTDWQTVRGRRFTVEVAGFSDCVGSERSNERLRLERVTEISLALARNGLQVTADLSHPSDDYLAANGTREGRKKNRGVLIRFIPLVTPETFTTHTEESRAPYLGIQVSAVTPRVALNRSLTEQEVLSVALTIFSAQSTAFERLQQWRDVIPFAPASSSFAEEDLPSNLIGFYRAARGYSFQEIRTLCGAWSEAGSIAHLRGYTFRPNRSFEPLLLPRGGVWPADFQTIAPASLDSEAFRILNLHLETPVFSVDCSIDPSTHSLRCR